MNVREDICRFCLKLPHNEFVLIDEATGQGLDVLLVRMNFDGSNDPVMCEDCLERIKRSLCFILTCLNAEKTILMFNTVENIVNINLRDVYEFKSKQTIHGHSYICRFCISKIQDRNFVPLKENLSMYMFQMEQNVVKNPIICFQCRDNMESYTKFLQSCHDTEETINMYRQNEATRIGEKIKLSNVFRRFSKSTLDYPNRRVCKVKKEDPSREGVKQFEFIDIYKSRDDVKKEWSTEDKAHNSTSDHTMCICDTNDSRCLGSLVRSNEVPAVTEDIKKAPVSLMVNGAFKLELEELHVKDEITLSETSHLQNNVSRFKICVCNEKRKYCDKCSSHFELVSKRPTLYKCKLCPYQGAKIKSHILRHRDTDVTMYKCTICNYETKYKNSYKRHQLTHKPETEVTMYKCTACDYESKHKNGVKKHSLIHKTKAEVPMYKCSACDYETKHKTSLKSHSLIHKTKAEVTMYKCTSCDYESKHKSSIRRHSLTHKTETEVMMYKCTACDFTSAHKENLKRHFLIHKTEAEVTMYKCTACDYETKHKNGLKSHALIHKTKAEVPMYKCTTCDYKTKYKNSIHRHLLNHKTDTEVTMYKCTSCDFKSAHKENLKRHSLTHKTEAEVPMYKCTGCDYKTKYKNRLKGHSLIHKSETEVTMYRCMACEYKTKYKNRLKSHLLVHKTKTEVT